MTPAPACRSVAHASCVVTLSEMRMRSDGNGITNAAASKAPRSILRTHRALEQSASYTLGAPEFNRPKHAAIRAD